MYKPDWMDDGNCHKKTFEIDGVEISSSDLMFDTEPDGPLEPLLLCAKAVCKGADPCPACTEPGDGPCWLCHDSTIVEPCPVKGQCLALALEQLEEFGIWGGLDPKERRAVLRENRRARIAAGESEKPIPKKISYVIRRRREVRARGSEAAGKRRTPAERAASFRSRQGRLVPSGSVLAAFGAPSPETREIEFHPGANFRGGEGHPPEVAELLQGHGDTERGVEMQGVLPHLVGDKPEGMPKVRLFRVEIRGSTRSVPRVIDRWEGGRPSQPRLSRIEISRQGNGSMGRPGTTEAVHIQSGCPREGIQLGGFGGPVEEHSRTMGLSSAPRNDLSVLHRVEIHGVHISKQVEPSRKRISRPVLIQRHKAPDRGGTESSTSNGIRQAARLHPRQLPKLQALRRPR